LIIALLTVLLPGIISAILRWTESLSTPISLALVVPGGQDWTRATLDRLLNRREPLLFGAALVVIGVVSTWYFKVPWAGGVGVLFYVWIAVFFFGYGAMSWQYVVMLTLVWRASQLPPRSKPFQPPRSPIRAIHRACTGAFTVGVALYALAIAAVWSSPGGDVITLGSPIGRLWVFPPAGFMVVFFLVYNFCLHRVLVQAKRSMIDEIEIELSTAYTTWQREPSRDGEARVTELLKWRDYMNQQHEWPMDLRSVVAVSTTLLLPTVKVLIDLWKL
jgi:hypothetical protein